MRWQNRPAAYSAVCQRWARAARQYGGYEGYKAEKSIFWLSRSSEFTKADNVTEFWAYTTDCARTYNRASTHKHTSRQWREKPLCLRRYLTHENVKHERHRLTLLGIIRFVRDKDRERNTAFCVYKRILLMQGHFSVMTGVTYIWFITH